VPSTLLVDNKVGHAPNAFTSIQAAVNAAHPGDTIRVSPGTYTEQVTLSRDKNHVRLVTAEADLDTTTDADDVILKAPATLTGARAIVDVNGAADVALQGFTIQGPADGIRAGVLIENGGSATLRRNHIADIRDTVFSGRQDGFGILVTGGEADIIRNRIDGYQKGGILIENAGSEAEIENNFVVGAGPTGVIAQNGIQVSDGANAEIRRNRVSGNSYTNTAQDDFEATGILLFGAGRDVEVEGNDIFANEDGLFSFQTSRTEIEGNYIHGNALDALLLIGPDERYNSVRDNVLSGNGEGVFMDTANNNVLRNNRIAGNQGNGITMTNADNNTIRGNAIVDNGGSGIQQDASSTGNDVDFNVLLHNGDSRAHPPGCSKGHANV
jgi:parallel beta-helix repeat protein